MYDQSLRNLDTSLGLSDDSLKQSQLSTHNSVKAVTKDYQKFSELEAKVRHLETEHRELLKENRLCSAMGCNS